MRKPNGLEVVLALLMVGSTASCDRERVEDRASRSETTAPSAHVAAHPAASSSEKAGGVQTAAGQTIYVPVYSQIPIGERGRPFDLAVTLSVRNTDHVHPLTLSAVRYYRSDGQAVRDYVEKSIRIAPMASKDFFVKERDTSGGSSASFLVEWTSEHPLSAPVVEAVMLGTASNQGVSFTTVGRVIEDRSR